MPISEEIIVKYQTKEYCKKTGYIIPVPSNQKVNAYLKEIADLTEITKNLTFHCLRHNETPYRLQTSTLPASCF